MRAIRIIAFNTFREIIRDRILYGLVVFSLLLMGFSMILGQLSFKEQVRISMNFGLSAIHLGCVVLSIFVGSTLVNKEIDKKTIMTLLVRPITRTQFLLGKALGLLLVNTVVMAGLAFVLLGVLLMLDASLSMTFFWAIFGILLEGFVLLGATLLFSTFSSPFMVVAFSTGVFLVGHWVGSLIFFAETSENEGFKVFVTLLTKVWPNFEVLNWRAEAVYGDSVPLSDLGWAAGYSIGWFVFLVAITAMTFRKKDFG
ncbi:MAG: ABC transporter permease [Pseudomonadota bacterium]